jgi:ketosteroid isomerase-like protein
MPTKERLAEFIATVERNEHVEAIERFYAKDASMQENNAPPRVGRDVLVEHETAALARLLKMDTQPAVLVLHDGDNVVIQWIFLMTNKDGVTLKFEELTHQVWKGDRIVRERFFYDSRQFG